MNKQQVLKVVSDELNSIHPAQTRMVILKEEFLSQLSLALDKEEEPIFESKEVYGCPDCDGVDWSKENLKELDFIECPRCKREDAIAIKITRSN